MREEGKNFFEIVNILGLTFDYFRQCVDAYKIIVKREERRPFPLRTVRRLIYCVEKCRFLENNVEEEYRLYESSIDDSNQLSRKKNYLEMLASYNEAAIETRGPVVPKTAPYGNSVFKRLFMESKDKTKLEGTDKSDSNRGKDDINKLFHEVTEEEKLNEYIQNCLHKILPCRNAYSMGVDSIRREYGRCPIINSRRYRSHMDETTKNRRQLARTIKVLEICNMTENPNLRVSVNTLLKELKKEYDKAREKEKEELDEKVRKRGKQDRVLIGVDRDVSGHDGGNDP